MTTAPPPTASPSTSGEPGPASGSGLDARITLTRGVVPVDVSLGADRGEVIGILGPNGGGKTTSILALAGVLPLEAGHVRVAGQTWEEGRLRRAPEDRRVGLMLADALLFPHLRAVDNVAYGPRSRGASRAAARARAVEELDRVGLADHARSRPRELSSGQAARVALARALATDPDLLLLDEPLAALDPETRARTRAELGARLAAYDGVTVLVTHDPLDALTLADRLVFIEGGQVSQSGTPTEVLREPRTAYVGTVVGLNLFAGRGSGDGHVTLGDGVGLVTADVVSGPVWATFPPHAVVLSPEAPRGSARNAWPMTVASLTVHGQTTRVGLAGPLPLIAEVTLESVAALGLTVGRQVHAAVKATEIRTYAR